MKTDLFPYEKFPIRLEYTDNKDLRICWFECEEHFKKHVQRYKLNPKNYKVLYHGSKDETDSSSTSSRKPRKTTRRK